MTGCSGTSFSRAAKYWVSLVSDAAAVHDPLPPASDPALMQSVPPCLPCLQMGRENKTMFKVNSNTHTEPRSSPVSPLLQRLAFKRERLDSNFYEEVTCVLESVPMMTCFQVKLQELVTLD